MIARIWRGWTRPEDAGRYERLFRETILPHVTQGATGLRGHNLLRYEQQGRVMFTTMFWFEDLADVRQFAGERYHEAVVPESARALLLDFDAAVEHHEVVL